MRTQKRSTFHILLLFVLLAAVGLLSIAHPVRAQAGSAGQLLAEVNAYRAANGLEAYSLDGGLNSLAQAQAEYMASINSCTHNRADGSGPGDHGISAENVACGMNLSVDGAIYYQWADALHSATMLGPDSGRVGAGVATSGSMVYYVLDVVRISGDFSYRPPVATNAPTTLPGQPTYTPVSQVQGSGSLVTSTPREDGAIIHEIQFGQTLFQIAEAYGISIYDLFAANPLINPTQPVYYEGDLVTIRRANTATPTPTVTNTPLPPTRTPRPSRTATPYLSPTTSLTPTRAPLVDLSGVEWNRKTAGMAVVLLSALGAVGVLVSWAVRGRQRK